MIRKPVHALVWVGALCVPPGCAYTSSTTATGAGGAAASAGSLALEPPPVTLLLDCQQPTLATTVHFRRVPSVTELNDAGHLEGLQRVVLDLPGWPEGYGEIQALEQVPAGAELAVLLPGYPPTSRQAEAWNQLRARVRIIVVARGAPPTRSVVHDLNVMRGLERLVVWTDDPGAFRPERLAAPVSLRVAR
jgi:hypothetical protein